MANDFTRLGFLASGTDVAPIVPALEAIWQNSLEKGLADFNFRSVTGTSYLVLSFSCSALSSSILNFILYLDCFLSENCPYDVCILQYGYESNPLSSEKLEHKGSKYCSKRR